MTKQSIQDQIDREIARYGGLTPTTSLPTIPPPSTDVASLQRSVLAIKQVLDTLLGASSVADRVVRVADILPAGTTTLSLPGYSTGGGAGGGAGSGGSGGGFVDSRPIYTTPPTLTNLTVAGTLRAVFIEWDRIAYQNHSYVEVWRNTTNTLGTATLHGTAAYDIYIDSNAAPGVTYYYWVRAVGMLPSDGSAIFGAYNAVAGTSGGIAQIGNTDLGPLIVEAQNLANSAIPTKMGVAKFDTVTLRGTGLDGSNPGVGGFYINSTSQGGTISRGFTVRVFDRFTHAQIGSGTVYDTHGDRVSGTLTANDAMAAALAALGDNRVVMVASYDACSFDSTNDELRKQLKRLGASLAIDGATGAQRFQYALVGIPGWGQGNGIEMLKPPTPGLPQAEVACFWLDNTILGSGSTINGLTLLTGDYFVDGSVQARHLAAGSIAVGTAAIANGAILNAMIADATIDSAKIVSLSADKLTAGALAVGQHITSQNYVAGASGWYIAAHGFAEFSNVVIRGATYTGTIYANAGTIGGITITAADIRSTDYVPGGAGFRITSGGYLEASNVWLRGQITGGYITGWAWPGAGQPGGFYLGPNGLLIGNYNNGQWVQINVDGSLSMPGFAVSGGSATFSGNLSAATGTFAGNLSSAGGTFSGVLTAAAVNAINSINLAGDAVTVPMVAQGSGNLSLPLVVPSGRSYKALMIGFQSTVQTTGPGGPDATLGVPGGGASQIKVAVDAGGESGGNLYFFPSFAVAGVQVYGGGTHTLTLSGNTGGFKTFVVLVVKS